MAERVIGVATAKRTGEMRILTLEEYFVLDEWSEARWEFWHFELDPVTGEPRPEDLEEYGFTAGGPTVIPGDSREIAPGIFEPIDGPLNPSSP